MDDSANPTNTGEDVTRILNRKTGQFDRTAELEKLVRSGKAAVAFSLYPVSVGDLMTVADAGEIMPPKSTWFEPKLRDGLLIHLI